MHVCAGKPLSEAVEYTEYSRPNSYPWSPFPPRRACPGPGPQTLAVLLVLDPGRAKREKLTRTYGLVTQSQSQNLAVTVLHVPESGRDCLTCARIWP